MRQPKVESRNGLCRPPTWQCGSKEKEAMALKLSESQATCQMVATYDVSKVTDSGEVCIKAFPIPRREKETTSIHNHLRK